MVVSPSGSRRLWSFSQFMNAPSLSSPRVEGKVMDTSPAALKASSMMVVSPSGSWMLRRAVQSLNAHCPMIRRLVGSVTSDRLPQLSKAQRPI